MVPRFQPAALLEMIKGQFWISFNEKAGKLAGKRVMLKQYSLTIFVI
jgi:hypothetical protein